MVGKRRNRGRRDWPSYLHERGGYYSWRHPVTGKEYGLGRDRGEAFRQAIEANAVLAERNGRRSLVDRLAGIEDASISLWADRYEIIVGRRDVKPETVRQVRRRLHRLREAWPDLQVDAVTTRHVADFLRSYDDRPRTQQVMRSLLLDFFREAMAAGWTAANPVEPTRSERVEVARARLTLEQWQAIHAWATAHSPWWLPRAMELALLTGQRREDIRMMGPLDVRDGYLWVEQRKTGNRLAIPIGLRLDIAGLSLAEAIDACRSRHILTRHFLHHRSPVGQAKPGHPIRKQTISGEFATARDALRLDWSGKAPATFHEIRSLAARLYAEERGRDFAQALLGHKTASMAALYRDSRGAEWVKVALPNEGGK